MPTNFTPLLTAWALTIIIILGGVMVLELTYDPEVAIAELGDPILTDAADAGETGSEDTNNASSGTDAQDPTISGQAETPLETDTQLPAPGQDTTAAVPTPVEQPKGLPIKPVAELLENTSEGPLPKIADDGRLSYNVYAAPRNSDITLSRISILITDLGKKANNTRRAVEELPAEISLGFSVYGRDLHNWGQLARTAGHEVLLAIPMEPTGYPQNDPGPLTLLTSNAASKNARLLRSSLARFSGYVGVVNLNGSRFIAASDSIRPVLDELKRRGLMFVDNRDSKYSRAAAMAKAINMPWAVNNRYLDNELGSDEIRAQLVLLEQRARTQGAALGIARSYPVSIRVIKAWTETLKERGFILVPVTSIANQQALPR
ncbi:MAG: hypothetical protein COB37_04405 [Kordiimonadales bacterium]|nr:MAG: hypothetical protein COB37_04405 [Kordiimonadales bacterium]